MEEIFTHYLRDNHFHRLGQSKSSYELNVATCRVVLDILPGLQKEVLYSTDGLVKRLYGWVRDDGVAEPLQSYATGLLGEAMELQEVATDVENRDRNATLVPLLIQRLRDFKRQAEEERSKKLDTFKRPFKIFGSANNAAISSNVPATTGNSISSQSKSISAACLLERFSSAFGAYYSIQKISSMQTSACQNCNIYYLEF